MSAGIAWMACSGLSLFNAGIAAASTTKKLICDE